MAHNDVTNIYAISKYIVDISGSTPYSTIQSALDAAVADGNNPTLTIRSGTYVEDLTIPPNSIFNGAAILSGYPGSVGATIIQGTHTPPTSGSMTFNNITFISSSNCFSSSSVGVSELNFTNCGCGITNGYFLNIPNWTGILSFWDFNPSLGTNDGGINNITGSSSVYCYEAGLGIGSSNVMQIAGTMVFNQGEINCPVNFNNGTTATFYNDIFNNTITTSGNANIKIFNSTIKTDSNIAITHNSSNPLTLSHDAIISSASTVIDGTGTINMGTVDFIENATIATTLTINSISTLSKAIHGWNGTILGEPSISVTSNGAVVTFSIEKVGGGDLSAITSYGIFDGDTTPAVTVTLTAGTDTNPVMNYVYWTAVGRVLTANTTGFPATEYIPVAKVYCQSAGSIQTDGVMLLLSDADHLTDDSKLGHISHINKWIRSQNATWENGVSPTLTITTNVGTKDNVIFTSASGEVFQLEKHDFPSFTGTPDVYVVNDSVTPFNKITDLNVLLTDSSGSSMSGRYFSLVVWGVVSENSSDCKLMLNLPSGSYGTSNNLLKDVKKKANFSIPAEFKGTGFLIAQLNLRHRTISGGTWTQVSLVDLRGLYPSIAAGGQNAQGSEFLDTEFRILDDGDNTKEIAFQASGITTATTRTITMSDEDIDLTPTSGTYQASISISEITSTSATAVVDSKYITNNAARVTVTLPSTAYLGSQIEVIGKGAGGWRIGQPAGVTIYSSDNSTTTGVGGYVETAVGSTKNTIKLVCITANNDWSVTATYDKGGLTFV